MDAITTYRDQSITAGEEITPRLMENFISWIDRSEKTARSYITNLRQFMAWMKYRTITRPLREDIISYRQWLTEEHDAIIYAPDTLEGWSYRTDHSGNPLRILCKPNTVKQYLRSVCQFFRWTAANGFYPDIAANIHAPKVTNESHRKEALKPMEVLAIENSIEDHAAACIAAAEAAEKDTAGRIQRSSEQGKRLYAMYLLAVNAGLRTIEISRANVKDLETKSGQAWLYIWGKGHLEPDKKKALAPEVAAAIREYLQSRADYPTGNSPLFVATGNRSGGQRLAPTTISTMLKKAMQQAGYDSERLTAHSLRHSAAQAALETSGNNIYMAQNYMRHSSPKTTEIYLHEDARTENTEREMAQNVYNLYHNNANADSRDKLNQIAATLTPQQLEQLTALAQTMNH